VTTTETLRWYWHRLRRMPPAEVPFRVGRAGATLLEYAGWRPGGHPPSWSDAKDGPSWIERAPAIDPAPYVAEAERVLGGSVPAFDGGRLELGQPVQWNRDPRTGRVGPLRLGKAIDYHDLTRIATSPVSAGSSSRGSSNARFRWVRIGSPHSNPRSGS
jgi:hypothetical protein